MNVVGHDHERVQVQFAPDLLGCQPFREDDLPPGVPPHFAIDHLTQQALAAVHADRHEVGTGRGIVESGQPDRLAMVFVRIIADHLSSISPGVGRGIPIGRLR